MVENVTSINDIEADEDEIDLIKLVSSNADIANQYVIFEGSNGEYYGINVAKVEELFIFEKSNMVVNNNVDDLIIGIAQIRSHMTPLIYFDEWFGNKSLEDELYELLILCYFSDEYLGLIVKQVFDIVSINPEQMYANAKQNELTTFIAKISAGKKEFLCTIFDTDRLLYDLYGEEKMSEEKGFVPIKSEKMVLFADDSKLVRKMAHEAFEKLGIKFKIFQDGQELLEALEEIAVGDIGLFLLDVEMPRKSGIDVIETLSKQSKYSKIPIVVHTNMANASIRHFLDIKNVSQTIGKVDFKTIETSIRNYIL